jgi:hypothetical protein
VSPIGVLFVLLTAGLAGIGIYALASGALPIGVAAVVLSAWMGTLAYGALRRR